MRKLTSLIFLFFTILVLCSTSKLHKKKNSIIGCDTKVFFINRQTGLFLTVDRNKTAITSTPVLLSYSTGPESTWCVKGNLIYNMFNGLVLVWHGQRNCYIINGYCDWQTQIFTQTKDLYPDLQNWNLKQVVNNIYLISEAMITTDPIGYLTVDTSDSPPSAKLKNLGDINKTYINEWILQATDV